MCRRGRTGLAAKITRANIRGRVYGRTPYLRTMAGRGLLRQELSREYGSGLGRTARISACGQLSIRTYGSGVGRTAAQKVYRRVRSSSSVRFRYPLAFFFEEISLNKNKKSNRCLLFTSGCVTLN